jgi:hypothetical protein
MQSAFDDDDINDLVQVGSRGSLCLELLHSAREWVAAQRHAPERVSA